MKFLLLTARARRCGNPLLTFLPSFSFRLRLPARVGGDLVPVDGAALHRHRGIGDERQGQLRRAGPRRREVHPQGVSTDRQTGGDPLPLHPPLSRQQSRAKRAGTTEGLRLPIKSRIFYSPPTTTTDRPSVLQCSVRLSRLSPLSLSSSSSSSAAAAAGCLSCPNLWLLPSLSISSSSPLRHRLRSSSSLSKSRAAPRKCRDPSQSE